MTVFAAATYLDEDPSRLDDEIVVPLLRRKLDAGTRLSVAGITFVAPRCLDKLLECLVYFSSHFHTSI